MPAPLAALAGTALRGLATKIAPKLVGALGGGAGAATTGAATTGAASTGAASTGGGMLSRLGQGMKQGIKQGVEAGKVAVKEKAKDPETYSKVANKIEEKRQMDEQNRIQRDQHNMDAAKRGAEITSGTTVKSQYHYADWVLEGPMHDAWTVLKGRMEIGPHDEQQDELFEHLKNLSGSHKIHTNDEDNSFLLDDVHDDDEDVVRRLIESYGRSFVDGENPIVEEKEEKEPRYF